MIKYLLVLLFLSTKIFAADTNTVSSTVVTNNTPPTANSPSVVVNNSDICKSAYSGAIQTQVLGISLGVTVRDMNCEMIKLARSLYGMNMRVAAVRALIKRDSRSCLSGFRHISICGLSIPPNHVPSPELPVLVAMSLILWVMSRARVSRQRLSHSRQIEQVRFNVRKHGILSEFGCVICFLLRISIA